MATEDFRLNELAIAVSPGPGTLALTWTGRSTDRQPARVLAPFFQAVLAEASSSASAIEMRFERLEHFNSSTLAALISFTQEARARGVRLVLQFDRALKWQRLSFDALRVLGKGDGLLEIRSV